MSKRKNDDLPIYALKSKEIPAYQIDQRGEYIRGNVTATVITVSLFVADMKWHYLIQPDGWPNHFWVKETELRPIAED